MQKPSIDARRTQGFIDHPNGPVYQTFGTAAPDRIPLTIDPLTLASASQLLAQLPLDTIPRPASLDQGSRMPCVLVWSETG
jgi:hypothetical protein